MNTLLGIIITLESNGIRPFSSLIAGLCTGWADAWKERS